MIPHVNESKEDIEETDQQYHAEKSKNVKWIDWILLNRPIKVIFALALIALVAPLLITQYLLIAGNEVQPSDGFSFGSCLVSRESRLPCGIEAVTPERCHEQCCYDYNSNMCFHRFPSRFSYISQNEWIESTSLTPRISTVPYGSQQSVSNIKLSIDEISATHLSLAFYESSDELEGRRLEDKLYTHDVTYPEISVVVNSTQGTIFNTLRGPLIASKDIWEITFQITEESMFGLGEIPLKDTVKMLYNYNGGLSSIPLIFAKSNGSYHGLLIDVATPTEIMVKADNQLVIRSITNWGLKFHLFVGPRPADIMKDVLGVIGAHKELEYWTLGVHVCSENTSENPQSELTAFITSANTQGLPFESHCGNAPIVFSTECDTAHTELVNQGTTIITNAGKRFMPHVSPYIKYREPMLEDDTTEEDENDEDATTIKLKSIKTTAEYNRCFQDELYKNFILHNSESTHFYIGAVQNQSVIYPDYEKANEEFMLSLWNYNTNFDGVILENSWPLDERSKDYEEMKNYLPYFNENFEQAFNKTPQWNTTRPITKNQDIETAKQNHLEKYLYGHNEYGNHFVAAFEKFKGYVPTMSSSQWLNRDIAVNRQNIPTSWTSLHKELVEASLGGISGQWLWSSPVCGDTKHFDDTTQTNLCAKWYMAATYMPLIKIHSKNMDRNPLAFIGTAKVHMITAITKRMSLLPYFYTVLQEGPLLRPMFYQYPEMDELEEVTTQFSVGDDLLIVPNLLPSQTHVHFVVPPGSWYEFWSGMKIDKKQGESVTMSTTDADFITLIRGGSILVMQKDVKLTTGLTQLQSPYTLIIALHCEITNITMNHQNKQSKDAETTTKESITTESTTEGDINSTICEAKGTLHMNGNMRIIFDADSEKITMTTIGEDFNVFCESEAIWNRYVAKLVVYGLEENCNNYDNHKEITANIDLCRLQIENEINFYFL